MEVSFAEIAIKYKRQTQSVIFFPKRTRSASISKFSWAGMVRALGPKILLGPTFSGPQRRHGRSGWSGWACSRIRPVMSWVETRYANQFFFSFFSFFFWFSPKEVIKEEGKKIVDIRRSSSIQSKWKRQNRCRSWMWFQLYHPCFELFSFLLLNLFWIYAWKSTLRPVRVMHKHTINGN